MQKTGKNTSDKEQIANFSGIYIWNPQLCEMKTNRRKISHDHRSDHSHLRKINSSSGEVSLTTISIRIIFIFEIKIKNIIDLIYFKKKNIILLSFFF